MRNPLPGVPLVESPFFSSLAKALPPEAASVAEQIHRDGFAVIEFPEDDFGLLADDLIAALGPHYDLKAWRERKGQGDAGGLRIQDAVQLHPHVRRIATNQRIIDLLSLIYGRRAFPFQTLNFPVGTEQHFHTDSIHFSSVPERFMCGVWVALEDIGADQGPLVYYPGSHRLPVYANEHFGHVVKPGEPHHQGAYQAAWRELVAAAGLEARTFCPKRGQALIWAANLLHGGVAHRDPAKTRWSQVTHYYFEECVYWVPMHSNLFAGQLELKSVTDLGTGRSVPHRYLGKPIPDDLVQAFDRARRRDKEIALPADFDGAAYLRLHPDVRAAGADPARHYLEHGVWEGRAYKEKGRP